MMKILLVGFGGFAGAISRYLVQLMVPHTSGGFPWGTFTANILGSLIIGIIYGLAEEHKVMTQEYRLFLAVGFCGSFTTFSTFAAENLSLFQLGAYGPLITNTILSVIFGVAAVYGGIVLTRMLIY